MAEQPSAMRRIVLPGPPSFSSRVFWWIVKLLLPLIVSTPTMPSKGPQIWELPPARLRKQVTAGTLQIREWKEESTGWVIPILRAHASISPPSPSPVFETPARRAVLYFHGGSFRAGITGSHWQWLAWLSEKLDADVYTVPYPLAPTNTGLEVRASAVGWISANKHYQILGTTGYADSGRYP